MTTTKFRIPKQILSIVLCLALLLAYLPITSLTVSAAEASTGKAMYLVNSNNPYGGIKGADKSDSSNYKYNTVYYGTYNSNPVAWLVLNTKTNTGKDGLFLLSKSLLGNTKFQSSYYTLEGNYSNIYYKDSSRRAYANEYQGSTAQTWCTNFAAAAFSTLESNGLIATTKSDFLYDPDITDILGSAVKFGSSSLSGDKVFFLSAEEAYTYFPKGSVGNDDRKANAQDYWWLRSPNAASQYTNVAGLVLYTGAVSAQKVTQNRKARPAFNLDMSSVLLTSAAEGGKAEGFNAVADYSGSAWKLTLLDSDRTFSASVTSAVRSTNRVGNVTISYSNATTGENEYISALIKDASGNVTYYGRIANAENESGTVTLDLSNATLNADDTLYIFNEQYNGDKATDYASAFVEVTVPSEINAYDVTFNANGGTCSVAGAVIPYTSDGKLTELPTPVKNCCEFIGWFDEQKGGTQITTDTVFTADTTIYAHWTDPVHEIQYSAADGVIAETCKNCDAYTETASLKIDSAADLTYTGNEITPLNVEYSEGWENGTLEITYKNNVDIGTATGEITYNGVTASKGFEISAVPITDSRIGIALAPESGIYNGSAYAPSTALTFNGTPMTENTDYTVTWDKTGFIDAETYTATITGIGIFGGSTEKSFTVNAVDLSDVEVKQTGTLTYNGKAQQAQVETSAVAVNDQPITFTYSTTKDGNYTTDVPNFTTAGTHTVYYKVSAPNHNTVTDSFTVKIDKAKVTVTADNASKTYGETDPALDWKVTSGEVFDGDTLNVNITRDSGNDVGTYAITVSENENANPNYDITFVSGTLTINVKPITVIIENKTSDYGDELATLTATTDGIADGDKAADVYSLSTEASKTASVGKYDITGTVLGDNYSITFENEENAYEITQREIGISWGGATFTYDGNAHAPSATATGFIAGDECIITVTGQQTDAGTYTATASAVSNTNYKLPKDNTIEFMITNAAQEVPNVGWWNETISKKADGVITRVTSEMEYRKATDTEYTAVTSVESETGRISNLEAGTYYVRYAEKKNYDASVDVEIVIASGKQLVITVPSDQVGYTLSVDKSKVDWNGEITITYALATGYSETVAFAVKVNGNEVTLVNGKYTVTGIQEDTEITVEGVADTTAPEAEMTVGTNSWNKFWNSITFGLFFKDTQTVTVNASDNGSEMKTEGTFYYLADKELSETEAKAITDWTAFNGSFNINPNHNYVVYVKAVDNAGNAVIINSDGIVLDDIAPAITGVENGATYYTTQKLTVTDDNMDTITVNGEDRTDELLQAGNVALAGDVDTTYTMVVTDKAGNSTTVTVTMKTIASVETPIGDITDKNVTSDDKDEIQNVIDKVEELLKDDDITDEEKKALEDIRDNAQALIDRIDDSNSPQTGDNGNLWLWFAFLFVSGGALFTLTVVDKKRKTVK